MKLANGRNVVARLARGDVNMPNYDGFPIHVQVPEVKFEAAVYRLLCSEPNIFASRLLYYRIPVLHDSPRLHVPQDIAGRRLLLFERAEGESNIWGDLSLEQKVRAYISPLLLAIPVGLCLSSPQACVLTQSARIRASLFSFNLPLDFAALWLLERLFEQKPKSLPIPVAPTREFCVALLKSKIEATIRNIGDMIGWEDDNKTVGPIATAAKQSLLRLIPYIVPRNGDQTSLYRLVLDHGDFGIHNMSITTDTNDRPCVTSLYDWETGCIVPAILSDPLMAVTVDLVTDENGTPSITRVPDNASSNDRANYMIWARQYVKVRPYKHSCLSVHKPRSNNVSARRLYSSKHPTTNVQSRQGRTHATFGLRYESGEAKIRKDISVIWDLGPREG